MSEEEFNRLFAKMMAYIQGKDLYVEDCFVCADERYRVPIRVIAESAWHNLFARNMFRRYNNHSELVQGGTLEARPIDTGGCQLLLALPAAE